nr:helix-turn-helix transcriptional regulator [uncultured Brevundimonas sp.]
MARFVPDPEVLRLAEALGALRRERGLSQAEAGARLDMTSQGWGLYESGRRPGLFRPDVQRRLTAALDATPEDLALIMARTASAAFDPAPTGVESRARVFEAATVPHAQASAQPAAAPRRLQLSSDELAPWAASGVVVEYQPGVWPRPGQGCVIETRDGVIRVRLYEHADAETLHLRGSGALDRRETLLRSEVASISAVTARFDI